jgi:hypothetical protein
MFPSFVTILALVIMVIIITLVAMFTWGNPSQADNSDVTSAIQKVQMANSDERPDDGGSKYLRNVGQFLPDYMAQHSRRQSSTQSMP